MARVNAIDLEGKVVLMTGADRGLGRAMSLGLVEKGARVVLASPAVDSLKSVAAEIQDIAEPGRALADDRIAALRAAFASMGQAGEFLAEVKKRRMELNISSGEAVEQLVNSSLDISPSLAKVAEKAWTEKK